MLARDVVIIISGDVSSKQRQLFTYFWWGLRLLGEQLWGVEVEWEVCHVSYFYFYQTAEQSRVHLQVRQYRCDPAAVAEVYSSLLVVSCRGLRGHRRHWDRYVTSDPLSFPSLVRAGVLSLSTCSCWLPLLEQQKHNAAVSPLQLLSGSLSLPKKSFFLDPTSVLMVTLKLCPVF